MRDDIEERLRKISRKSRQQQKSLFWLKALVVVLVSIACYETAYIVDTQVFPAVSKAFVFNVAEKPSGVSFFLRFRKYRDCEIRSFNWLVLRDGEHWTPVRVKLPTTDANPNTLPTGNFITGPFFIRGINKQDIHVRSAAHTTHQCHWLWKHQRIFFD